MTLTIQIGLAVALGAYLLLRLGFCLIEAYDDADVIKRRDQRVPQ